MTQGGVTRCSVTCTTPAPPSQNTLRCCRQIEPDYRSMAQSETGLHYEPCARQIISLHQSDGTLWWLGRSCQSTAEPTRFSFWNSKGGVLLWSSLLLTPFQNDCSAVAISVSVCCAGWDHPADKSSCIAACVMSHSSPRERNNLVFLSYVFQLFLSPWRSIL